LGVGADGWPAATYRGYLSSLGCQPPPRANFGWVESGFPDGLA